MRYRTIAARAFFTLLSMFFFGAAPSNDYLAHWYALHLRMCLKAWVPPGLRFHPWSVVPDSDLQERLQVFSQTEDQAKLALALCDLLGLLSAAATVCSPLHPYYSRLGCNHE